MAAPVIDCLEYGSITPADARALTELAIATWPPSDPAGIPSAIESGTEGLLHPAPYTGPAAQRPRIFCLRQEKSAILAQSRIFPRTIATPRGPLTAMGLGGVCTAHAARGHGLGMILMRETFRVAVDSGDFACSLFQTRVPSFYERLGARVVTNRFVNSLAADPGARPFWDPVTMVYPRSFDWPEGVVDLQGPGY
jgi:hypothetical protein